MPGPTAGLTLPTLRDMEMRLLLVTLALVGGAAHAQVRPGAPSGIGAFIAEGGVSVHGSYSLTAGITWDWRWRTVTAHGEWTGMTEVFASHWNSPVPEGRETLTQVGVLPVFRMRFDQGRSDWFMDLGIGLTYSDRLYRRRSKQFSTRFNFEDMIGVGRSFGAQREHDLSLRLAHISNAGIRNPNPGENFVQLRYARRF